MLLSQSHLCLERPRHLPAWRGGGELRGSELLVGWSRLDVILQWQLLGTLLLAHVGVCRLQGSLPAIWMHK